MTTNPVEPEQLLDYREHLLARMAELMGEAELAFLASIESEQPDFALIQRSAAADMPAIRHKLANLAKRSRDKRTFDRRQLDNAIAWLLARRNGSPA